MSDAVAVKNEKKYEGSPLHDTELIDALKKIYNEIPSPSFQSYHEGRQAGIRYTLLALNVKIDGINR